MVTKKKCGCKKPKEPKIIGLYGGGKYHNCIHHVGSGKCVHPERGEGKRGGSGICRYTAETEQKCPGYFGYDKYYSHSKGGKK
jgi:flagellar basal body rod protein FlgF